MILPTRHHVSRLRQSLHTVRRGNVSPYFLENVALLDSSKMLIASASALASSRCRRIAWESHDSLLQPGVSSLGLEVERHRTSSIVRRVVRRVVLVSK